MTDPYPIIPGTEHWNPYHDVEDLAADRWGREFVVGIHFDIRQPSRLTGLCTPVKSTPER